MVVIVFAIGIIVGLIIGRIQFLDYDRYGKDDCCD